MHRLQHADALHIQPCKDAYWQVCNPVDNGEIAVIDAEALSLLGHFRAPATLEEVSVVTEMPVSRLERMVAHFLTLGLLNNLDQDQPAPANQTVPQTLSAWLHVTNACNLRCSYCYITKTGERMEEDTARRAIDTVIRSAVRHGYRCVALKYAGGEAALSLPQVFPLHDYAQQQAQRHNIQLSASILTNGTIMTRRMIEQLKERQIHVTISLDGIGAAHDQQRPFANGLGSFRFVDRTITQLLNSQVRPSINVVVSQHNIAGLPELIGYILERDLSFTLSYYRENDCSASRGDLQFSEAQMIDGMRSAFAYIEDHLPRRRLVDSLIDKGNMRGPHHYTCGAGRNYLVIDQRGGVAKCQADIAHPVTTIDADDPLRIIRTDRGGMQAIDVDEKEGCRTCTWRHWCGGGCPLVTYRVTGRNDIRSPNCAIYKALFPEAVRLEALRLLKYGTPIAL